MTLDPATEEPGEIRQAQADGAVLLRGPHLSLRIAVLTPGVVLVSARGEVIGAQDVHVETALLAELELELERAGTLTAFIDLRQSPRVPAASREKLADWARRHRARLRPCHVLVQSKLIEMALSVIAMLIGGGFVKIHTKLPPFMDAIKAVAPTLTELPAVPWR